MTPKYSAQWWEKVAARPQQPRSDQDELYSGFSDESETPHQKTKRRKPVCKETA
jgi:hypothetical protein